MLIVFCSRILVTVILYEIPGKILKGPILGKQDDQIKLVHFFPEIQIPRVGWFGVVVRENLLVIVPEFRSVAENMLLYTRSMGKPRALAMAWVIR